MKTLLALRAHPEEDPAGWAAAARLGAGATVVVRATRPDPALRRAVGRLAGAGASVLGHIDLDRAARPLATLLAEVRGWTAYPVKGLFLDRAPADDFGAGPVALVLRAARRAGLAAAMVNPGRPVTASYRRLGARLCTFEGPWDEYARWSGEGAEPGDGHLVYGVPEADIPTALCLVAARGADFCLLDPA